MNLASARRALALSCCHHWWMPSSVQRHPSISSALTCFFARLSGKDVGARFALPLLEVVIQWAACLIHQVDGSFLAALLSNRHPPGLAGHLRLIEQQPGHVAHPTASEVTKGKHRLATYIGLPFHQVADHLALVFRQLTRSEQGLCWDRNATDHTLAPGAAGPPATSDRSRTVRRAPAFYS